jgi:bifunctional DNase/RNase
MDHEAEIEGIGVGMGAEGGVPAVILAARGEYVPIFVTDDQAHSIEMALQGEPFERPLTHDLLLDFVTELGGAVDRVRIDDLTDGTFYAKIDIQRYDEGEAEKFVFDARPSDSIALAVRAECPVVISDEVLDEAGRDPAELEGPPEDEGPQSGVGGAGRATEDPFTDPEDLAEEIEEELEERDEDDAED